jgi:hypothetical protein
MKRECATRFSYAAQQVSGVWSWVRDAEHVEKAFDFSGMGASCWGTSAPTAPIRPCARNLKVLIEYAKKNSISYGSAGNGTLTHLAMGQLKQAANFEAVHAPYRGIAPGLTDLMGGRPR